MTNPQYSETLPALEPMPLTFFDSQLRRLYLDRIPTSASSGVIPSGSANPTSPTTGELFFRTDQGKLYMYDGSNWLQLPLHDSSGNLVVPGRILKS